MFCLPKTAWPPNSESDGRSDTARRRGQPERTADEDENLGGAGSLERGKPILRFFDTQEQREPTRKRDCPELQVRRTGGRLRTNPFGGTDAGRASVDPRPAEGRAPGRRKPRRAGRRAKEKSPRGFPIGRGDETPGARPRPRKRAEANRQRGGGRREASRSPTDQALEGGTPGARLVETPGRSRREQGVEAGRNGGGAT